MIASRTGRRRLPILIGLAGVLAAILSAGWVAAPTAWRVARIAPTTLVSLADFIVIAKVTKVAFEGEMRVATATVQACWKGEAGSTVRFRASGSWTCDTSAAIVGETALLFLTRESDQDVLSITHSGRGRMAIRGIDGAEWAQAPHDVRWPAELLKMQPFPPHWQVSTIRVEDVRNIVQSYAPYVSIVDGGGMPSRETVILHSLINDRSEELSKLWVLARQHFGHEGWTNYGPDSNYREIIFFSAGEKVILRSWHPIAEQNPGVVAASYGLTALEGRSREEFLSQDDQAYVAKRKVFDAIEARLRELYAK